MKWGFRRGTVHQRATLCRSPYPNLMWKHKRVPVPFAFGPTAAAYVKRPKTLHLELAQCSSWCHIASDPDRGRNEGWNWSAHPSRYDASLHPFRGSIIILQAPATISPEPGRLNWMPLIPDGFSQIGDGEYYTDSLLRPCTGCKFITSTDSCDGHCSSNRWRGVGQEAALHQHRISFGQTAVISSSLCLTHIKL